MITARIDEELNGFWLLISHDNEDEDCSLAITKEEVEPIMEACQEYLKINQKE